MCSWNWDQGLNSLKICQGKLNIYAACAGIDLNRTLAIHLDVGTNNDTLLKDPTYLGIRENV